MRSLCIAPGLNRALMMLRPCSCPRGHSTPRVLILLPSLTCWPTSPHQHWIPLDANVTLIIDVLLPRVTMISLFPPAPPQTLYSYPLQSVLHMGGHSEEAEKIRLSTTAEPCSNADWCLVFFCQIKGSDTTNQLFTVCGIKKNNHKMPPKCMNEKWKCWFSRVLLFVSVIWCQVNNKYINVSLSIQKYFLLLNETEESICIRGPNYIWLKQN